MLELKKQERLRSNIKLKVCVVKNMCEEILFGVNNDNFVKYLSYVFCFKLHSSFFMLVQWLVGLNMVKIGQNRSKYFWGQVPKCSWSLFILVYIFLLQLNVRFLFSRFFNNFKRQNDKPTHLSIETPSPELKEWQFPPCYNNLVAIKEQRLRLWNADS